MIASDKPNTESYYSQPIPALAPCNPSVITLTHPSNPLSAQAMSFSFTAACRSLRGATFPTARSSN